MNTSEERDFRRRYVALIGRLDAQQSLSRQAIEMTIDDMLAAARAAGWKLPEPNSRRKKDGTSI